MLRKFFFITPILILIFMGSVMASDNELQTVDSVDLNRYLGLWFQLAYFPTRFQPEDCGITTAEYSLKDNGRIRVVNTCWGDEYGEDYQKQSSGTAWAVNESNTKLKVRFFWPFTGDYWIIDLGDEYEYAVVSEPSREYLWILCREMSMDNEKFAGIIERLRKKGFDLSRLVYTADQEPPQ